MKKLIMTVLMFALIGALCAPVAAQFGDGHSKRGMHSGRGRHGGPDFDKRMKRIEQLRMLKMLEILDLNDEQSDKFLVVFNKTRKNKKALHEERRAIADTLSATLDAQGTEEEINRLLDKMKSNMEGQLQLLNQLLDDCRDILTPYQLGRLALFHENFERDMIKDLMNKRGDSPPPEIPESSEGK